MKKIICFFTLIMLFSISFHAMSKSKNELRLKINQIDTLDNEVIIQQVKSDYTNFRFDFGLNAPQDQGANLSTSFWGSRGVNFTISRVRQIATSKIGVSYGFGVGHVRFMLDNQKVLDEVDGSVKAVNFGNFQRLSAVRENRTLNFKKSIFTQTFFDFPVELQYHGSSIDFKHGFYVSLGYKIGVNISNKMKINYTADGSEQVDKYKKGYFVNEWRQAMTFRVGWSKFHLFCEYSLTPIFRSGQGPDGSEMKSFMIGFSINDSL